MFRTVKRSSPFLLTAALLLGGCPKADAPDKAETTTKDKDKAAKPAADKAPAKKAPAAAATPAAKPKPKLQRPKSIPAPPDVADVPADADKTPSGLASKVLIKGAGTANPAKTNKVRVHYTGWTTDGKMFDSSVVRGRPATFPLNRVIAGWTEGVQLMVKGEKRRFWIPANLAYEGKPGPQGLLVFDVELLEIL